MKPSIGRIVIFIGKESNSSFEHPAIITRVWSDDCVNLTVFLDNTAPMVFTSITQNEGAQYRWKWPERV